MGIDSASVKLLCAAKLIGVDFASVATIGRQSFWPDPATLRRVFSALGKPLEPERFLAEHPYAEEFFRVLGAEEVESVDASDYEEATHVHDLNTPLPEHLKNRFTVVHDGGTIEHVFHVTQALKNCMEMVRVGGHFTQVNEANNYCGHGFWQFSPEMIFRALSPENGFQIRAVLLYENVSVGGNCYLVKDPKLAGGRVELCNRRRTYILTIAKRIAAREVFAVAPQQSDYVVEWASASQSRRSPQPLISRSTPVISRSPPLISRLPPLISRLPLPVKRILRGAVDLASAWKSGFDPRVYTPVSEDDLIHGRFADRSD